MYTLEQATEIQEDFLYIIDYERRIGMETSKDCIILYFKHGGVLKEYYKDKSIEATMPSEKKYLELKSKYFPIDKNLSIFYPYEFKKRLDGIKKF